MNGLDSGCVVVGGGPGGMMLTYLLGQAGVPVTLLETHRDFDRDFRGDSLHPYTLELLDRLGLADELLRLPHQRARYFRLHTAGGPITAADYGKLRTRFDCVTLMPQARFLEFLATALERVPAAQVRTGCKVTDVRRDRDGRVDGVVYRDGAGTHELAAGVVVATDGRFSKVRRAAGVSVPSLGASTDLLWFRLPHRASDPAGAELGLFFGRDHYVGLLTGTAGWQVGYSLPKGGYPAAREAGVAPIRAAVARQVPWLADRVHLLEDFSQTTLLSVEIARAERWWRPGLLLLGDAAHIISPVGGNGILMAVQDAVTAANHLVPVLRTGEPVSERVLAAIQAERQPAVERVQAEQVRTERRVAAARETGKPIGPPRLLRLVTALPTVRARSARANAYGPSPPVLDSTLVSTNSQRQEMPIMTSKNQAARTLDVLADRSVLFGYSRLGYRLRRRCWSYGDPARGALAGKTAVVTGANSGLGQATALGLARLGARVVMVVRDQARGQRARSEILRELPDAELIIQRCDVADLADVDRCADELAEYGAIDVLVHNAGVLPPQRTESAQGHELTLATHVLGPLRLTERLRPALAASADARVVWVCSGGMYTQPIPEDLEYRADRYRGAVAYARTKRLQVAFTVQLAERYRPDGIGVHAMHPGWADTPGVADSLPGFRRVTGPLLRSPAEGADTTVWLAATRPAPPGGRFWHDRRPRPTHYLPWKGDDPGRLRRAWQWCADAAGIDQER